MTPSRTLSPGQGVNPERLGDLHSVPLALPEADLSVPRRRLFERAPYFEHTRAAVTMHARARGCSRPAVLPCVPSQNSVPALFRQKIYVSRAEYGDEGTDTGTEAMTSRSAFGTMLFTVKVLDFTLPDFQTRY